MPTITSLQHEATSLWCAVCMGGDKSSGVFEYLTQQLDYRSLYAKIKVGMG